MRVEDKIQDIFELEANFGNIDGVLQANVENHYDDLANIVFKTPLLRNRIYHFSTCEIRFVFSWCDQNWQEYLVKVSKIDETETMISITQATNYKVEGGVILNE